MSQETKKEILKDHCRNKNCFNFSRKYDLNGIWCQDECFIEAESGERISRQQLLEMKVDYDWTLEPHEINEIKKLKIIKSPERISKD